MISDDAARSKRMVQTVQAVESLQAVQDMNFHIYRNSRPARLPPAARSALGDEERETDVDDVGVHAGIVATCIGIGHVMKLVAERQRPFRGEKKLHA
jgi:hypothetical protein